MRADRIRAFIKTKALFGDFGGISDLSGLSDFSGLTYRFKPFWITIQIIMWRYYQGSSICNC